MKTKDFTCVDFGSTSLVKYKNGLSLVTPMEQLKKVNKSFSFYFE